MAPPARTTQSRPPQARPGLERITPEEAERRRFLLRKRMVDTVNGYAPVGSHQHERDEAFAERRMVDEAQSVLAGAADPDTGQAVPAPPERQAWAKAYLENVERERRRQIQGAEEERAILMPRPDDVRRRIEEWQSSGTHHRAAARAMQESGWNMDALVPAYMENIEENIQVALDTGDFDAANRLRLAKGQMIRYGSGIDPNGPEVNWTDAYLDEALRREAAQMGTIGQLATVAASAGLDSARLIQRIAGTRAPQEQDMLQRMAAVVAEESQSTAFIGGVLGSFMDPGWYAVGGIVAKGAARALAGKKAKAAADATQAARQTGVQTRYAERLIAQGTPASVATAAAARLTPERQAIWRIGQWAQRTGSERLGLSMGEKTSETVGSLIFRAFEGAIGNAAIEAGIASSEQLPFPEVLQRTFLGAAMGVGFGMAFDRIAAGIGGAGKRLWRTPVGKSMPPRLRTIMEEQIEAARVARLDDAEIDVLREQWTGLATQIHTARSMVGRNLDSGQIDDMVRASGIDVELAPRLREQARIDETRRQHVARTSEEFVGAIEQMEPEAMRQDYTGRVRELEALREQPAGQRPPELSERYESRLAQLEQEASVIGEAYLAREGVEIEALPETIPRRPTPQQQAPGSPEFEAAQARVMEIESRLIRHTPKERRAELVREWEVKSDQLRGVIENPSRRAPGDWRLIRTLRSRISQIEESLAAPKIDPTLRKAMAEEMERLRAMYPEVQSRLDDIANGDPPIRPEPAPDAPEPDVAPGAEPDATPVDRLSEEQRLDRILHSDRRILGSDEVKEAFRRGARLNEDEAGAVSALLDARAQAWAEQTGQSPEDWYSTRFANTPHGPSSPAALFHTADDGFGYRRDYRPNPETELPRMRAAMRARRYTPGRVVHTTNLGALESIVNHGVQPSLDADGRYSVWGSTVSADGQVQGSALSYGRNGVPVVLEMSPRVKIQGPGDDVISSPGKSYVHPDDIERVYVGDDPNPYTLSEALARLEAVEQDIAPSVLYQEQPQNLQTHLGRKSEEDMGFWRKSDRALEKLPERFDADQLSGTLRNAGVSEDELKWTGIAGLIDEAGQSGRRLTRQDVRDAMQADGVVMAEVRRGDGEFTDWQYGNTLRDEQIARFTAFGDTVSRLAREHKLDEIAPEQAAQGYGRSRYPGGRGPWTEYVDPETLRLSLIRDGVPAERADAFINDPEWQQAAESFREGERLRGVIQAHAFIRNGVDPRNNYSRFSMFQDGYREHLMVARGEPIEKLAGTIPTPHFAVRGVVAHARTSQPDASAALGETFRMTPGRRSALVIEEIQSDWLQARQRATHEFEPDIEARVIKAQIHTNDTIKALRQELERLREKVAGTDDDRAREAIQSALGSIPPRAGGGEVLRDYMATTWIRTGLATLLGRNYFGTGARRALSHTDFRRIDDLREALDHSQKLLDDLTRQRERQKGFAQPILPPEGPLRNKWVDTMVRRMLRTAAEEDHGFLMVVGGEAQVARYQQGDPGPGWSGGLAGFYDKRVRNALAKAIKPWKGNVFEANGLFGVEITPEMRDSILREGFPLWQRNQNRITAATEFLGDGRAAIRFFEHADISSAVHEIGHVLRRDLDPRQREIVEQWAGVENNTWTRKAEEKFARGFERYLRDGQAPTPELRTVFGQLKAWLTRVYRTIRTGPLNVQLSDDVRRVYDELLGGPEPIADALTTPPILRPKPSSPQARPRAARKTPPEPEALATPDGSGTEGAVARQTPEPAVTGDTTPTTQAQHGKRESHASPARDQIPAPRHEPVQGSETVIQLADGRRIQATYTVMSATDLIPSHDAREGFTPNKFGDPNERNYNDPTEGAPYRATVRNIAQSPQPDLLLTDTPSPADGPPIVGQDRVVLGGNARTMAQQLIYQADDLRSGSIRGGILARAERFGVDPDRVAEIPDPVLVRVVPPEEAGGPGELSRILNEGLTTARTPDTDAASRGRMINIAEVASILGDGTIREGLANPTTTSRLLQSLQKSGAMTGDDTTSMIDQRGLLNQSGRDLVERMLVGSATGDARRMAEASPATRQRLVAGLSGIGRIRARADKTPLDFDGSLRDALDAVYAYRTTGARSLSDLLSQTSMIPEPWRQNARALGIANSLLSDTPGEFRRKMNVLADAVEGAASGQGNFFLAAAPDERIAEVFTLEFPIPEGIAPGPAQGGIFGEAKVPRRAGESQALAAENQDAASRGVSPYNDQAPILVGDGQGQLQTVPILNPVPPPELLTLAREILGDVPTVRRMGTRRGAFRPGGGGKGGRIIIDPDTAADPLGLARTLAHEIGHAVDWMPEGTMKRGNLVGRVLSLQNFLRQTFGGQQMTLRGDPNTGLPADQVISNKVIRNELKALSRFWKPYHPDLDPPKYVQYRESAAELYADAISVWLNSPGLLEKMAPAFTRALYQHLDRKPSVLREYLNIQDFLGGTSDQIMRARRADIRESQGRRAEVIRARAEERKATSASLIERYRVYQQDKGYAILKREDALLRRGVSIADEMRARYALDELEYIDSPNHLLLSNLDRDVWQPMREADVSFADVGEYLFLRRVVNERDAMANPRGHTPETAAQQLDYLRRTLGPERVKVLEERIRQFDDMIFERAEEAVRVGVYNRETFETIIKPNKGNYAAFSVLDHLEEKVSAAIHEQIGTFKDIENPFEATILKTLSLNRLIVLNDAKNRVRDLFLENMPDDMVKRQAAPGGQPKKARPGRAHITVLENGHHVYYETDEYVAKAFQLHDIGVLARVGRAIATPTYRVFHPLFVTYNPAFATRNVFRDFWRTYRNIPPAAQQKGAKISLKDLLIAYADSFGPSWRRARDTFDPLIHEMYENKALDTPFAAYDFTRGLETEASLMQRYGLHTSREARNILSRAVEEVFAFAKSLSVASETLSKAAAYQALSRSGIDGKFRTYAVHNYAGTPNFRKKGLTTEMSNGLWMYSNVKMQSIFADLAIATDPKSAGGFWMRSLLTTFLPKITMRAAAAGLFGAGVKTMFDSMSDYDKANYITVPFGVTKNESTGLFNTAYLKIPHEDNDRLLAIVAWLVSEGEPVEALASAVGHTPYGSWSPWVEMSSKWLQYAQGINPIDDFRRREIINRDAWKAGGWASAQEMIRYSVDQFGVATLIADGVAVAVEGAEEKTAPITRLFDEPGLETRPGYFERTVDAIGGFTGLMRMTNRGISESQWDAVRMQDEEQARMRVSLAPDVREIVRERYRLNRIGDEGLTDAQRKRRHIFNDFYQRGYLPLTRQLRTAMDEDDHARAEALRKRLREMAQSALTQTRNSGDQ